jgi:hypothetical protein
MQTGFVRKYKTTIFLEKRLQLNKFLVNHFTLVILGGMPSIPSETPCCPDNTVVPRSLLWRYHEKPDINNEACSLCYSSKPPYG